MSLLLARCAALFSLAALPATAQSDAKVASGLKEALSIGTVNAVKLTGATDGYFGNPLIKEAQVIVDWSGLAPGYIGVYQINCRIPGAHVKGDALPVTMKVGGVSSSTTGATAAKVWVE